MSKLLISKYSIYLFLLLNNDHYIGSKVPWVSDKVEYILFFEIQETIYQLAGMRLHEIHHIEKQLVIVIPIKYMYTSIPIIIIFVIMTFYFHGIPKLILPTHLCH